MFFDLVYRVLPLVVTFNGTSIAGGDISEATGTSYTERARGARVRAVLAFLEAYNHIC